ncbi:hypothetical protein C2E23DRAFT_890910 [Lenzites betulinus]|nr:hypothetical protein C2E23DRAFT_890910 [Lenzites betulinus]
MVGIFMAPPIGNDAAPAVYRCLLVAEIFEVVVDSIHFPSWTRRHRWNESPIRGTLIALARTSKPLHEATIPWLWRVAGPFDLLRIVPEEMRKRSKHGPCIPHARVEGDKRVWARFHHYAQHMRHFRITCCDDMPMEWDGYDQGSNAHALENWARICPRNQRLFPQLRRLEWRAPGPKCDRHIQLFLARTIQELALTLPSAQMTHMPSLLSRIGKSCPNIVTLHVDVEGSWNGRDASFKQCKGGLHLSVDLLQALATHPALHTLDLDLEKDDLDAYASTVVRLSCEGFRCGALKELTLKLTRLDDRSEAFLYVFGRHPIGAITLTIQHQPRLSTVKSHIALLARSACGAFLTDIRLTLGAFLAYLPWPSIVTLTVGDVLEPLYALPHIKSVCLWASVLFVDAATVRDIAAAWPALERLMLLGHQAGSSSHWDRPLSWFPDLELIPDFGLSAAFVPLDGLVPLVRNCPRLRELELKLNVDVLPDDRALALALGGEPSRCQLRLLETTGTPLRRPERVIEILRTLFPDLQTIKCIQDDMMIQNEKRVPWEMVEQNWLVVKRSFGADSPNGGTFKHRGLGHWVHSFAPSTAPSGGPW